MDLHGYNNIRELTGVVGGGVGTITAKVGLGVRPGVGGCNMNRKGI